MKYIIYGFGSYGGRAQGVIIPALLNDLNAIGIPDEYIYIIIALGTHREMSEEEIKEKYGSH